jgi:hypothetical protein
MSKRAMGYEELSAFTGPRDQYHKLIDWNAGRIAVLRAYKITGIIEGAPMQRQFTIELRVDYADNEKNEAIRTTLKQCARRTLATANLIADNPKATTCAIWSDDFFSGHEEIALLDDVLGEVTDETVNETGEETGEEPSAELMGALKDG